MKSTLAVLIFLLAPPAFADMSQSCESPQVDNIMLSAYAPGCSGDSGTDAATPGGLRPSKFKLDGKGSKVVLAAAPMRMPGCASKCYKYVGGNPDDGAATSEATDLSQKTFYFDDLCPGCAPGKKRGARIDLSMSCKLAKGFRIRNATLKPVPCSEEVFAEIKKNGETQIASGGSHKRASRQTASVIDRAQAGR